MSNPSNISYTNKDFNSIYSELLQYAKELSYKWDPTSSDESDPGVVLLKLAALIGDKDSYNIDKNILELMPASVSQIPAARMLFDACGYSMHHYKAAHGKLNLTLTKDIGDVEEEGSYVYTLPKFTTFTDEENSIKYSTITDTSLFLKESQSVDVYEGTPIQYTVNNDPLITLFNLDTKNRLYFTEYNVAENAIFITNAEGSALDIWEKVDNLYIESKNKLRYKFGVTPTTNMCYVEFPEDVASLFGKGIYITYFTTSGSEGTASRSQLKQLFTDTKVRKSTITGILIENVDITTEQLHITNSLPINNGKDPESIDEAYKNYQKVKTTFDTLVSLKDYTDYMVNKEYASNGYICDRTNDIQHSHVLRETNVDNIVVSTCIDESSEKIYRKNDKDEYEEINNPSMKPFDLCIYGLKYVPNVTDAVGYNDTFKLMTESESKRYINGIQNKIKSLQHNFKSFEPYTILMIKNKYLLKCTILPKVALTVNEAYVIKSNVERAIFNSFNSKEISFGSSIDPVKIKNVIMSVDPRIQDVENNFSTTPFETYAVYVDNDNNINEVRIDIEPADVATGTPTEDSTPTTAELIRSFRADIRARNIVSGVSPLCKKISSFTYGVGQQVIDEVSAVSSISTSTKVLPKTLDDGTPDITVTEQSGSSQSKEFLYTTNFTELRDNESVVFSKPSFVEDDNYSSYTKIIYYLPDGLVKDEKHELTDNEFIVFFWQTNDDVDYNYCKYSKNSEAKYISSSFNLLEVTQDKEDNAAVLDYFRKLPDGTGKTSSTKTLTINGETKSESTYVSDLTTSNQTKATDTNKKLQVLIGTNIMYAYRVDSGALNAGSKSIKAYWFLNKTSEDGTYLLFDNIQNTSTCFEYVLQTGEYFVYTDETESKLSVLGEGNRIHIDDYKAFQSAHNNINQVSVEAKATSEELFSKGIEVLQDLWFKFYSENSGHYSINKTSYLREQIGPGNQLTVEFLSTNGALKNTIKTYSLDTLMATLSENYKSNTQTEKDAEPWNVSQIVISYKDKDGKTTILPMSSGMNINWNCNSLMSVNMTTNVPQPVYDNQEVTFNNGYTANSQDGEPAYILSTVPVISAGGSDIKLVGNNEDPATLLVYKLTDSKDEDIVYNPNDFSAKVSFLAANGGLKTLSEITIDRDVTYLFTMNSEDGSPEVSFNSPQDSDLTFNCLLTNNDNNDSSIVYMLRSKPEDPNTVKDTVSLTVKSTKPCSVYIGSMYKFEDPLISDKLKEKLLKYDSGKFDYTNLDDVEIEDPLDPQSFFKKAHAYNPYTICQWHQEDKKDGDIKIKLNIV